ncbi:flagellar hook-associated protein 2 [Paenibacillus phyllosphaerae]|uniref:Flagellar hook-associated protein 2 n=1 Tax=Paenibacillus phyllosphaerae TaxID=274593 RepID=A0A7W5B4G8_9BACL|nr:flagellar filament capping protein FliD [Paenibacillus phyllosphaerae]MBB3114245.1 flagellar hook-associated protein 2 [Paenibacillus phyllosphaerae]
MTSVNRLSGLVSGLDTDTLIKSMMTAARVPVDKMNQEKQNLTWKRDDYRTINSLILDFKNAAFDMKLQSSYLAKTTTSSNDSAVSASGNANAVDGSYAVVIKSMAKAPSLTTGPLLVGSSAATSTTKLSDLGLGSANSATENFTLKVTGAKGESSIAITNDMTVTELVTQINSKVTSTGVKATYDSTMNRIFFVGTQTGEKTMAFSLTDANGTASSDLGEIFNLGNSISSDTTLVKDASASSVSVKGQNAEVTFNDVTASYESNTFSIAGLTITAKAADPTSTVTLTVTQNTDKIYDSIKTFVDKYNTLIDAMNTKITETHDRDYTPLTDAQKEEMTDDQIEKWETLAKTGLLSRDSTISSGLTSFRRAFADSMSGVSSTLNSLSKIGIGTTIVTNGVVQGTYSDKGKIYIDETKLKAAIAENPDEVMKLFTADDKDSTTSSGDGLATRLYTQASNLFSKIVDKAGTSTSVNSTFLIGKQINNLDTRIDDMEDRLADLEDRYYSQFTTMETYLSKMNSTSSWLTSQFSS